MSNLPQYTLPGLVHYLQTEWTRNEKDRIQWANEREEMKATISKLQSENDRLKRQLLVQHKESQKVNAENYESKTNTATVDALVKAREHLQTRMDEVLYLLRGSNVGADEMLGARDFVPLSKQHRDEREHFRRVTMKILSQQAVETEEVDPEEIEKELERDIETDNETLAGDIESVEENPLVVEKFPDIEGELQDEKPISGAAELPNQPKSQ